MDDSFSLITLLIEGVKTIKLVGVFIEIYIPHQHQISRDLF